MQCFLNRGSGTGVSPVMFLPKPGVSLAAARNTGEDARGQNKITGETPVLLWEYVITRFPSVGAHASKIPG